jgi:hypothetical protein
VPTAKLLIPSSGVPPVERRDRWGSLSNLLLAMKCCVIDHECYKSNHTEENDRENNCKRPENPGPWLSF